jgi:serine/threonine protein kinase
VTIDQKTASELDARVGRIADEFLDRLTRGDAPTVEEYATAQPDLADVLRGVLQLVLAAHTPRDESAKLPVGAEPPPERLGEFRIVREVGRGGMGIVYEAVQEPLGRRVALKVLPAAVQLHPGYIERFRREAQAAARLHHTNIVPVFGVGDAGGVHYYGMQFIDGVSLDSLSRQRRNDPLAVARWGLQVAEALAHAHAHGVLHRDVKPANLLLDSAGTVWVTDFGLAKLADAADLTASGDFVGTLRYTAPECLGGQADARADVYSLGATLYELLTGRQPFDAAERDRLVRQIAEQEPPRPRTLARHIPRDLETVVLRALAKEQARRYASACDLADDLRRFLDGRPVAARRPTLAMRLMKWARRHPGGLNRVCRTPGPPGR